MRDQAPPTDPIPNLSMPAGDAFLQFQRAKFKTKLPAGQLYTQSHMWLRRAAAGDSSTVEQSMAPAAEQSGEGLWQIGLTRFALRMLGDPVELDFELKPGDAIETGRVVGWLEGFKAVTDLYTPMGGQFVGGNPALDQDLETVKRSSYDRGWLFAIQGTPGDECLDAEGYAEFLGETIDRMLGEEQARRNQTQ